MMYLILQNETYILTRCNMKEEKQTVNNELRNYVQNNLKRIIETLVKLNCIQENITLDYEIVEKVN